MALCQKEHPPTLFFRHLRGKKKYLTKSNNRGEKEKGCTTMEGGSSSINTQVFLRACPEDFQRWATEVGCPSWGWTDVLPWYIALEADNDFGNEPHHGADGPVAVRREARTHWRSSERAFFDACTTAGFPECTDANAPDTVGGVEEGGLGRAGYVDPGSLHQSPRRESARTGEPKHHVRVMF